MESEAEVNDESIVPIVSPRDLTVTHFDRVFAIAFGMAVTLCLGGYQFGHGNHSVYLLDGLRRVWPELLTRDWFTMGTLQYHVIFSWLTATLIRLNLLEPGFLAFYLLLVFFLQFCWLRIVERLGGSILTYLVSVVIYHLMAGGIGLGMFQFMQDGSFLPSNVANVAMLWGFYFWMTRRFIAAGVCLGLAGLFHVNHAVMVILVVTALSALARRRPMTKEWLIGFGVAIVASSVNLLAALYRRPVTEHAAPLSEFVQIFVRLRHPHHFDPSSWPIALWIAFFLPFPLAVLAWRRARVTATSPADAYMLDVVWRINLIVAATIVISLIGAGIWYVSETLVQLSFYRFCIYLKLFTCIGTALWLCEKRTRLKWTIVALFATPLLIVVAVVVLVRTAGSTVASAFVLSHFKTLVLFFILLQMPAAYRDLTDRFSNWRRSLLCVSLTFMFGFLIVRGWKDGIGLSIEPLEGAGYAEVCDWARGNTPIDAVFLVPPDEQSFRLNARRAIVINFKGIAQLSGELLEWRRRMEDVLDMDITTLPRPYPRTFEAIRARYDSLEFSYLTEVAHRYDARYLLVRKRADATHDGQLVYENANGPYFLYDLAR